MIGRIIYPDAGLVVLQWPMAGKPSRYREYLHTEYCLDWDARIQRSLHDPNDFVGPHATRSKEFVLPYLVVHAHIVGHSNDEAGNGFFIHFRHIHPEESRV
jgi:hypothetical protein